MFKKEPHSTAVRNKLVFFKEATDISPEDKRLLQNADKVLSSFNAGLADTLQVQKYQGPDMRKVDEFTALRPGG